MLKKVFALFVLLLVSSSAFADVNAVRILRCSYTDKISAAVAQYDILTDPVLNQLFAYDGINLSTATVTSLGDHTKVVKWSIRDEKHTLTVSSDGKTATHQSGLSPDDSTTLQLSCK